MIRAAIPLAIVAATACAGPSSTVPTGFESENCVSGPRLTGTSEMGVTNEGLHSDTDMKVVMAGRVGGGCVGVARDLDDR